MAINKKLIHFKKKETFDLELSKGNILGTSIVFIQDAKMIWTHGTLYSCPYTKEELDTKFTELNSKLEGGSTDTEVCVSTIEPTGSNCLLWINPENNILKYRNPETTESIKWLPLNVLTDPDDGEYYVRKNKKWTQLPVLAITDLSMVDIHGNDLTSRTTANCYVVKELGTYKFPLVYGNAIKNGSTNSKAYTRASGNYTADFLNVNNTTIKSPYIETDLNSTIDGAELSVCDTNNIFSDISVVSGTPCKFILFTVKSIPHTGANGIISAKVGSTICWSWHIWVWEDDLTPITITNSTRNNYDILPVNLGSKYDEDSKTHIKNWFYLWGRSVPQICPSAYNSNTKAANYGEKTVTVESTASNVSVAIKNPASFYKHERIRYNWINVDYFYNFWDANCTTSGASDNKVVKTVYDPCPPGYCVGNGNTFTGFSASNVVGSFQNGWKFKANSSDTTGIFFPASGNLSYSLGSLGNVGSNGGVWSSALYGTNTAYYMYLVSSNANPMDSTYRASGLSVRPVREL